MSSTSQKSSQYLARNMLGQALLLLLALIIMFPFPVLQYSRYALHSPYFALVLLFPVFFYSLTVMPTRYYRSQFTIWVWGLRCLAVVQILLAQFYTRFSVSSYVAFLGSWMFSILYEVGFYLALRQQWELPLRRCAWFAGIICIPLLAYVVPLIFRAGPQILASNNSTREFLRQYVFAWPNYLSIYLVVFFWLVVHFNRTNKRYVWLLGIILLTTLITFSRTGVTILGITIVFWIWRRQRQRYLMIFVVLTVILIGGIIVFQTRASSPGDTLSQSITNRVRRWGVALEQWAEHPVLGYGFKSYTEVVPTFYALSPGQEYVFSEMNSSHNDYVDLLVRGGILHSLGFWGFVIMLVLTGLRASAKRKEREVLQYLSYIFLALLLAAFVQNPFKNAVILTFFWYMAGVLAALSQRTK